MTDTLTKTVVRCTTTERSDDTGEVTTVDRRTFGTLAAAVRIIHDRGWLPDARSGAGQTILETWFETVER